MIDKKERDDAMETLYLLAAQVGIGCAICGTKLGRDNIAATSWMAPRGTNDYEARAYCLECAEAMRE